MAIAKRALPDWRARWKPDEWWEAFGRLWFIVSCAAEATTQVAERDGYAQAFHGLANYHNRLVATLDVVRATRGNEDDVRDGRTGDAHLALLHELSREALRVQAEIAALQHRLGERAFDGEDASHATLRIALERGLNPGQWARYRSAGIESAGVSDDGERVTAQNERTDMRKFYTATLEQLEHDLSRARSGRVASAYVPIADLIVQWEARAQKLRGIRAALTMRHKPGKRRRAIV